MSLSYSIIDHPADTGLELKGSTVEELFEAAAVGMFSLITDLTKITEIKRLTVTVEAHNNEDLLINWLQELLYLFAVKHLLFAEFSVQIRKNANGDLILGADCGAQQFNPKKHEVFTEIKTATYHQLMVQQATNNWQGRVIFDL